MTSDPLTPQERARYLWLIAGRQAEVLTEPELAELIAFTTRLEQARVQWAEEHFGSPTIPNGPTERAIRLEGFDAIFAGWQEAIEA